MNKVITMSQADKKTKSLCMAGFTALALMTVVLMSTGFIFAAGNPIDNLGQWILDGLRMLIAAFALVMGVVSIVKGQTVKGVIVLVAGAILFALCSSPETFASIGTTLLGALGF